MVYVVSVSKQRFYFSILCALLLVNNGLAQEKVLNWGGKVYGELSASFIMFPTYNVKYNFGYNSSIQQYDTLAVGFGPTLKLGFSPLQTKYLNYSFDVSRTLAYTNGGSMNELLFQHHLELSSKVVGFRTTIGHRSSRWCNISIEEETVLANRREMSKTYYTIPLSTTFDLYFKYGKEFETGIGFYRQKFKLINLQETFATGVHFYQKLGANDKLEFNFAKGHPTEGYNFLTNKKEGIKQPDFTLYLLFSYTKCFGKKYNYPKFNLPGKVEKPATKTETPVP